MNKGVNSDKKNFVRTHNMIDFINFILKKVFIILRKQKLGGKSKQRQRKCICFLNLNNILENGLFIFLILKMEKTVVI